MRRYTTPTLVLKVGKDLTGYDVYVSLAAPYYTPDPIKATDMTVEENVTTIRVPFDQKETAKLREKATVKLQVNWISASGVRGATDVVNLRVTENLLEEVITYGD